MKRLASVAIGCFILLATELGLAQQTFNPSTLEPPYGYYHTWGGGPWGWPAGMLFGPIVMLLTVVSIVALIVSLIRGVGCGFLAAALHVVGLEQAVDFTNCSIAIAGQAVGSLAACSEYWSMAWCQPARSSLASTTPSSEDGSQY